MCSPKFFFYFLSPVKVRNFGNFLIKLNLRVDQLADSVGSRICNFLCTTGPTLKDILLQSELNFTGVAAVLVTAVSSAFSDATAVKS